MKGAWYFCLVLWLAGTLGVLAWGITALTTTTPWPTSTIGVMFAFGMFLVVLDGAILVHKRRVCWCVQ